MFKKIPHHASLSQLRLLTFSGNMLRVASAAFLKDVCLLDHARNELSVNELLNLDILMKKYLQRKLLKQICASGITLAAQHKSWC